MPDTAGQVRIKSIETFLDQLVYMDVLVFADLQRHVNLLWVDTECNLEDQRGAMDDREG